MEILINVGVGVPAVVILPVDEAEVIALKLNARAAAPRADASFLRGQIGRLITDGRRRDCHWEAPPTTRLRLTGPADLDGGEC